MQDVIACKNSATAVCLLIIMPTQMLCISITLLQSHTDYLLSNVHASHMSTSSKLRLRLAL